MATERHYLGTPTREGVVYVYSVGMGRSFAKGGIEKTPKIFSNAAFSRKYVRHVAAALGPLTMF